MAIPAVSYSFSNGTTADASQVNTNFTDLINSLTDGTKSLTIDAITCAGTATFNGAVTLGNGSVDDITFTGSVASTIPIKTNASFNIGSATLGLASVYIGSSGSYTTRLVAGATSSWTLTLPVAGGTSSYVLKTNGSGTTAWVGPMGTVATKAAADSPVTAAASDILLCNATAGAITVNLPAAASNTNCIITVKKIDSTDNAVTIEGNASELVEGVANKILTIQYESVTLVCDGTGWYIV